MARVAFPLVELVGVSAVPPRGGEFTVPFPDFAPDFLPLRNRDCDRGFAFPGCWESGEGYDCLGCVGGIGTFAVRVRSNGCL